MHLTEAQLDRLKDFKEWNEEKPPEQRISLFDYATFQATPDLLFGFAALLICDLVEVEGHYFIAARFNASYYDDWKTRLSDKIAIQRVMNHIHLTTILQNADADLQAATDCANLIASVWSEVHASKGVVGEVQGSSLEDLSVTLVNKRA